MWICKQHQIQLLYLPAHSSHVLQPLDLAPFSVIKSSYRQQIQELASLDDAAPVKKERFITCYYQAREAGLTERVIRAGWLATGLSPFNINKVLTSSQVSQRPTTPPSQQQPQQPPQGFLSTPQGPTAGLEAEKRRLEQQVEDASPQQPRKRVQQDPNLRFTEVDSIREAMHAAEVLAAQHSRSTVSSAREKAAVVTAAIALESMCTQWQLN
ncbi:Tigger transposable element-derived protein 2 [Paraphaeosphaeria sporulosa]